MTITAIPRASVFSLLVLTVLAVTSCQSRRPAQRGAYRVVWSAFRAQDNQPLAAFTSPVFGVNGSVDVRTDSTLPTDDRPAFPRFTAQLSPNPLHAGTLQLVTRAYVKEVKRTRKGKRKVNQRVIGGLLPIRSGETQDFNGQGDAIHLTARLEGGGVRTGK